MLGHALEEGMVELGLVEFFKQFGHHLIVLTGAHDSNVYFRLGRSGVDQVASKVVGADAQMSCMGVQDMQPTGPRSPRKRMSSKTLNITETASEAPAKRMISSGSAFRQLLEQRGHSARFASPEELFAGLARDAGLVLLPAHACQ
jgi:hypothetical protein